MTDKNIVNVTRITTVSVFIVSLTQTAFCTGHCAVALVVFLFGWLSVLIDLFTLNPDMGASFAWLANPLILIALIVIKKNSRKALVLSITATVLILSFLLFGRVMDNEAGHYNNIISYNAGYWLWLFSSLILMFGSFILTKRNRIEGKETI